MRNLSIYRLVEVEIYAEDGAPVPEAVFSGPFGEITKEDGSTDDYVPQAVVVAESAEAAVALARGVEHGPFYATRSVSAVRIGTYEGSKPAHVVAFIDA